MVKATFSVQQLSAKASGNYTDAVLAVRDLYSVIHPPRPPILFTYSRRNLKNRGNSGVLPTGEEERNDEVEKE